jgi:DNA-binding CsgD family transcriptional regulator
VFDADARFAAAIDDIRREFGLTRAERRVYEAALYQSSSHQIAETLCLSRETVRTHLKNIFSKVGISKHVDLIQHFVHRSPSHPARYAN